MDAIAECCEVIRKKGENQPAINSDGVPETWLINETYLQDIRCKNGLKKQQYGKRYIRRIGNKNIPSTRTR